MALVLRRRKREDYGMYRKGSGVYGGVNSPYKKTYKRKRFVPGIDRTGGFYNRFAGRSGELKFHDHTVVIAGVPNLGVIPGTGTFNIIPQGVTESSRVGRKCTIKSLMWRYQISIPSYTSASIQRGDSMRIMIYIDKQANGATAIVRDILETEDIRSFRNMANTQRFTILSDRMHTLNHQALSQAFDSNNFSGAGQILERTFYKTCNVPIEFGGVTGAIGEIRSNNICMLFITDYVTSQASVTGKLRMRFSDNGV